MISCPICSDRGCVACAGVHTRRLEAERRADAARAFLQAHIAERQKASLGAQWVPEVGELVILVDAAIEHGRQMTLSPADDTPEDPGRRFEMLELDASETDSAQ